MAYSSLSIKSYKSILRWCLFALVGLSLTWLVSCGGSPVNNPATPEIEFWTMQLQPEFNDYFNRLVSQFETANPGVKVRWVDVPWTAMESKILSAVSAKTAPDVVNLNPSFASQLAAKNAWLNLSTKVPALEQQKYLPNIWQASTLNNQSFGLPWYLTTPVNIYNKDLLQKAGIAQPPKTYAELAIAAKQIKEKTGKSAIFVTFVPQDSGEVLESLVQMGVKLVDAQGQAAFNTPEGKAAFQYWVDMYKQNLLPKDVLTQGHRTAIELYQAGEVAFLSSGAEFMKTIATNAPDIAKVSAAAPQITGTTGKKNVAVMNLVIPQDSKNPDWALKFALYVTNTENQLAFAEAANVLPSTVESVQQYQKSLTTKSGADAVTQARSVSAAQLAEAEVLVPAMKDAKKLQQAIYENLQAAMLGEKTVDQAIADAANQWNQSQKS